MSSHCNLNRAIDAFWQLLGCRTEQPACQSIVFAHAVKDLIEVSLGWLAR